MFCCFHAIECVSLMLIPLEWFCGCALLLTFNCVIFDNMNSVEITLPQRLGRFRALVYDYLFMVMVRGECIRFLYIYYFQRDKFFLWLQNWLYKIYNKDTLNQTVFNELCFLRTKSNEGVGERGVQNHRQ